MTTGRSNIETFDQLQDAIREASQHSRKLKEEMAAEARELRRKILPLKKLTALVVDKSNVIYWAGLIFALWRRYSKKK